MPPGPPPPLFSNPNHPGILPQTSVPATQNRTQEQQGKHSVRHRGEMVISHPPFRHNHRAPRPKSGAATHPPKPKTERRTPRRRLPLERIRPDSDPNANVRLNASRRPKPISATGPMGSNVSTVG